MAPTVNLGIHQSSRERNVEFSHQVCPIGGGKGRCAAHTLSANPNPITSCVHLQMKKWCLLPSLWMAPPPSISPRRSTASALPVGRKCLSNLILNTLQYEAVCVPQSKTTPVRMAGWEIKRWLGRRWSLHSPTRRVPPELHLSAGCCESSFSRPETSGEDKCWS